MQQNADYEQLAGCTGHEVDGTQIIPFCTLRSSRPLPQDAMVFSDCLLIAFKTFPKAESLSAILSLGLPELHFFEKADK